MEEIAFPHEFICVFIRYFIGAKSSKKILSEMMGLQKKKKKIQGGGVSHRGVEMSTESS